MPSDVWHCGADGVAVAESAELKLPRLHSFSHRRPASAGSHETGLLMHRQGDLIVSGVVAAEKCCGRPDGVFDAETFTNIKSDNFALDVPLGFCKWLNLLHNLAG